MAVPLARLALQLALQLAVQLAAQMAMPLAAHSGCLSFLILIAARLCDSKVV